MKKKILAMMIAFMSTLFACGGGGGSDSTDYTPSVYVAGNVSTMTSSNACYWKDGVRVDLPGENGRAYGIAVANGHVYVVGDSNGWCYWLDGVKYNLTGNGYFSRIKVVGSTVYISGTSDSKACVWSNGNYYKVSDSGSYAYGMEIINDTIYLLGGIGVGGGHAAIWTKPVNGGSWTTYNLSDSDYKYSEAYAVANYNGIFYIVGYLYSKDNDDQYYPALWQGNALDSLTAIELSMHNDLYIIYMKVIFMDTPTRSRYIMASNTL